MWRRNRVQMLSFDFLWTNNDPFFVQKKTCSIIHFWYQHIFFLLLYGRWSNLTLINRAIMLVFFGPYVSCVYLEWKQFNRGCVVICNHSNDSRMFCKMILDRKRFQHLYNNLMLSAFLFSKLFQSGDKRGWIWYSQSLALTSMIKFGCRKICAMNWKLIF